MLCRKKQAAVSSTQVNKECTDFFHSLNTFGNISSQNLFTAVGDEASPLWGCCIVLQGRREPDRGEILSPTHPHPLRTDRCAQQQPWPENAVQRPPTGQAVKCCWSLRKGGGGGYFCSHHVRAEFG